MKDSGFRKCEEVRLGNGAIIVPVAKTMRKTEHCEGMVNYLKKARWTKCRLQSECVNALYGGLFAPEAYDGFSCERCPHQGREMEDIFTLGTDKAVIEEDASGCARLWAEALKGGAV